MESSKLKSTISFIILVVCMHISCACKEDERKALIKIKQSTDKIAHLMGVDDILSTWDYYGNTASDCCDWERMRCDPTTGYVSHLSLGNLFEKPYYATNSYKQCSSQTKNIVWHLDFSQILQFKELRSLNLSHSYLDKMSLTTGLGRLSTLKKLEILDLSNNFLPPDILPLIGGFTSLKYLNLSNSAFDQPKAVQNFSVLSALKNLEVLDLSMYLYKGALQVQELSHLTKLETLWMTNNKLDNPPSNQGCESLVRLVRLESLNLGFNNFTKSFISCLSFLPSLKFLGLRGNHFEGSFPTQDLLSLRRLKTLDLSKNMLDTITLNGTMNKLQSLDIGGNLFSVSVDEIMRTMVSFPSLRHLSLDTCFIEPIMQLLPNELPELPYLETLSMITNTFSGTIPMKAFSSFPRLKVLDLRNNHFVGGITGGLNELPALEVLLLGKNELNGTLPIDGLLPLKSLQVLDLSNNNFVGSIPKTISALSSLKVLSFAKNRLNGSLLGLCELKNLNELDVYYNMFDGNLPECFNTLSSLQFFDISYNQITGVIPPSIIANLKSLEYLDFSHNKFEGLFSFSSFSNHTKLKVVSLQSDSYKFEVETEEPIGWVPMFQLDIIAMSNCNINNRQGSVFPSFFAHQNKLQRIVMAHNSMQGVFPFWVIKKNGLLEELNLRNNSFGGGFHMAYFWIPNIYLNKLDISRNHLEGVIPNGIQKFFPCLKNLNLSTNSLDGVIPSSVSDLDELDKLDLSHNHLSGEVPVQLLNSSLSMLILSNNSLHGKLLSGNKKFDLNGQLHLDNNLFSGNLGSDIKMSSICNLSLLDISNNFFTGWIPDCAGKIVLTDLNLRNNRFEGQFPCGTTPYFFLDLSRNNLSGLIPSCSNFTRLEHLHLGSNRFTGSIPISFRSLTKVLVIDIGNNYLSGHIPKFIGELYTLRILVLRKNRFTGPIPNELCRLINASLIDFSSNILTGSIPSCLRNITGPSSEAFMSTPRFNTGYESTHYSSILWPHDTETYEDAWFALQDEVSFTTKSLFLTYKGGILDLLSGLDLSCNNLTGEIPEDLGLLTHIHVLNLSHNELTGSIPGKLSNLANLESLDISFNSLTGKIPWELSQLNSLAVLNVSFNNLSGALPDFKGQFSTFTNESYVGNPLLCGPPLDNKCTKLVTHPSNYEGSNDEWYDMDMTYFYGFCGSSFFIGMAGFVIFLCMNHRWRRRWVVLFNDLVRKVILLFRR